MRAAGLTHAELEKFRDLRVAGKRVVVDFLGLLIVGSGTSGCKQGDDDGVAVDASLAGSSTGERSRRSTDRSESTSAGRSVRNPPIDSTWAWREQVKNNQRGPLPLDARLMRELSIPLLLLALGVDPSHRNAQDPRDLGR